MIVVVNFKTYKQGNDVIKLAKAIEKVDKNVIVGVQATDIFRVCKETKLKVFAEHVVWQEVGRNTGYVLPEAVKEEGAEGVFLNHSEHRLDFEILKKTVERCKKVGLKVLVFASDLEETEKVVELKPDYIAVEPPELVAGKISVSTGRPELISDVAKIVDRFLVGAGIHNREDVVKSLELGASGIAVSSAVVTAKEPGKVLRELMGK